MTVLALASCASTARTPDIEDGDQPPEYGTEINRTAAIDVGAFIDSGVGVVANGCAGLTNEIGSGITVGQRGQVVTTAHTVAGAVEVTVVDRAGTEFAATVVALDKNADLALLDVPTLGAPPLDVGQPVTGDATAVVWSRDLGVHTVAVDVTRRLSITIEDIYVEDVAQRSGIELRGEISVGDSGGAVVDAAGHVIGIVYARSRQRPQTAFATDATEIEQLLSERPADAFDRCT